MDNPTFHIQVNNGEWQKIDDIEDMSIVDLKVHPGNNCPRSYWEVSHEDRIQGFISEYVREKMEKGIEEHRRRMLFGDFVSDANLLGIPTISPTLTKSRLQQVGRAMRGEKACAAFHELRAQNPNISFAELVRMHQIQFAEIEPAAAPDQYIPEPETKTVQYRGFTLKDVPGWVKYVITDYYGDIYGYENKPKFLDVAAVWTNVGGGRDCRLRKALVKGAYAPEKSLVEL